MGGMRFHDVVRTLMVLSRERFGREGMLPALSGGEEI
jgi:hypothetical protein